MTPKHELTVPQVRIELNDIAHQLRRGELLESHRWNLADRLDELAEASRSFSSPRRPGKQKPAL